MELMNEFIEKIRKDYQIPAEYKTHVVNSGVWEKFKDKKIEWSRFTLHEELMLHVNYGYHKHKDFVIVNVCDIHINSEGGDYTFLFTKNLKKTFEKYFKKEPIKEKKFIARKGIFKPVQGVFGWQFEEVDVGKDDMPILNDNLGGLLTNEIKAFLDKEDVYKKMGIEHKRGVLLLGPPGNGKTNFIKSFTRDFNAMTILASSEDYSQTSFLRRFLEDLDNDHILKILVFEDIDGMSPEVRSSFLNFLDGLTRMHKVLFIATTNFPDRLDIGLKNRPSRFDTLLKIDAPNEISRAKLIRRYFADIKKDDLDKAVKLSEGFSGAYFKEIYILSQLNGCSVIDSIKEIKRRFELLK